jgi:predicted secreted hydrolase
MLEKEKRNYLARWNGERGADRNPADYSLSDNGSHFYQTDQYYEWWYIDCAFDNGYNAVITYHFRNEYTRPKIPTTQVMIYKPDGTKVTKYIAYPPEQCYAGADYCDVRMGGDWLKDTGDGYECYIKIRGVGLHLKIKGIVPAFKFGSGYLYKNEETALLHSWVIPIPHGEVSGEMFLDDKVVPVQGSAYHDHNWGTGGMSDLFSGWDWGRIHGGRYTVDFSWCMPRDKEAPILSYMFLARDRKIILATDMMHAEFSDYEHNDATGQDFAKTLSITTDVKGVKIKLDIHTTRVVETMDLPPAAGWKQYYFRFLADYDMQVEIDGEKDRARGELLHELMLF